MNFLLWLVKILDLYISSYCTKFPQRCLRNLYLSLVENFDNLFPLVPLNILPVSPEISRSTIGQDFRCLYFLLHQVSSELSRKSLSFIGWKFSWFVPPGSTTFSTFPQKSDTLQLINDVYISSCFFRITPDILGVAVELESNSGPNVGQNQKPTFIASMILCFLRWNSWKHGVLTFITGHIESSLHY